MHQQLLWTLLMLVGWVPTQWQGMQGTQRLLLWTCRWKRPLFLGAHPGPVRMLPRSQQPVRNYPPVAAWPSRPSVLLRHPAPRPLPPLTPLWVPLWAP